MRAYILLGYILLWSPGNQRLCQVAVAEATFIFPTIAQGIYIVNTHLQCLITMVGGNPPWVFETT